MAESTFIPLDHISPDDPTAKALRYVHETPVEGSNCANCMYVTGEDGQQWRPCAIFPNKTVNANGWCSAWLIKGV